MSIIDFIAVVSLDWDIPLVRIATRHRNSRPGPEKTERLF